jgi:phospholipid-binding lipoprotein MlaA
MSGWFRNEATADMTKVFRTMVWGVLLAAGAGQSFAAAPPEVGQSQSAQTIFVDLTKSQGGDARSESAVPPSRAAQDNTGAGAAFVDLTGGATATAMPVPQQELPRSRVPRTKLVDLTNGAQVPDFNEPDSETDSVPDTVLITADRLDDPYEESNRGRFNSHVWLHRRVIDPVERVYIGTVPTPARDGLHNFLFNLETPSVLVNDLFQGNISRAGDTLARFVVNSTLGLGGLFDVAGKSGMRYRDNDFGATLATYGVGDYPYLLVPVIGPSNPRDLTGKTVDFLLDPLHFVTLPGGIVTSVGRTGAHELDKRSVDAGELDMLARTAPDPYAQERAMARKRRAEEVGGGEH